MFIGIQQADPDLGMKLRKRKTRRVNIELCIAMSTKPQAKGYWGNQRSTPHFLCLWTPPSAGKYCLQCCGQYFKGFGVVVTPRTLFFSVSQVSLFLLYPSSLVSHLTISYRSREFQRPKEGFLSLSPTKNNPFNTLFSLNSPPTLQNF